MASQGSSSSLKGDGNSQRWSRGCSNGIGPSGSKNQYRLGVCIENWVEDSVARDAYCSGTLNGASAPLATSSWQGEPVSTTQATIHRLEGKTGGALAATYNRVDLAPQQRFSYSHKFPHGNEPDRRDFVTMSKLTYRDPLDAPDRVTKFMWTGQKAIDCQVAQAAATLRPTEEGVLRERLRNRVAEDRSYDPYQSEAKRAQEEAARLATSGSFRGTVRRRPELTAGDGGNAPTIGRKMTGEFVATMDRQNNALKYTCG